MSEPITATTSRTDPPAWWAPLLAALAAADAAELRQRHTSSYTQAPAPSEWWPASPRDDAATIVTRERDGSIHRRLVVTS